MITTPLVQKKQKESGGFSRGFWSVAFLACVVLGCFAFSARSQEEALIEEESVGAFQDWLDGVGGNRFDSIGIELEFHQALTKDALLYDHTLYSARSTFSGGDPLIKIVAETGKKTELVTGVAMGNQENDLKKMRDIINIGRQLSLDAKSNTVGMPSGDRTKCTTMLGFGKQFDIGQTGTLGTNLYLETDTYEIRGEADPPFQNERQLEVDNIAWNPAGKSWSPQVTAQGPPGPHLAMIKPACATGDAVAQNPPQTEDTDIKKLLWIVQEEMCRGVNKYMTTRVSETKETVCFLPKATNIADKLKRGEEDFATWCLKKYPALENKEQNGPGYNANKKMNYQKVVTNLLNWADGTTKTATLGAPANFPTWTDTLIRIEYRRAKNFWTLQDTPTGGIEQKQEIRLDVVKGLFQGCVPKTARINKIKDDCNVP